jgi:hypothetical protein
MYAFDKGKEMESNAWKLEKENYMRKLLQTMVCMQLELGTLCFIPFIVVNPSENIIKVCNLKETYTSSHCSWNSKCWKIYSH